MSAPRPAAKRSAPTTLAGPTSALKATEAAPVAASSGESAASAAAGAATPRDLGALGTFSTDDGAVDAFLLRSNTPTSLSTRSAPEGVATTTPVVAGAVAAPAAAAPGAAAAPTAVEVLCAARVAGADSVARAEISGVAVLVVSFATPALGRIQVVALEGCAVRFERSR